MQYILGFYYFTLDIIANHIDLKLPTVLGIIILEMKKIWRLY